MAYDPQRDRRRPKPSDDGPAPIETILDADTRSASASTAGDTQDESGNPVPDDPPPDPSVTPQPADPWSDQLLFGVSISTIAGAVFAALVIRWLWVRSRRSKLTPPG
jgi:hypothetical protein